MAVLDDLGVYLPAHTSLVLATSLWLGYGPESPNTLTIIREYAGLAPEWTNDPLPYECPKIQVLTRGEPEDWDTPRTASQNVWNVLNYIKNQTINGVYYRSIRAIQSPFPLRRDALARQEWACNYQIYKAVS